MTDTKMIEEMAKTLCGEKEKRCENCDSYKSCEFWVEASILHNVGYRKQSEGEWVRHKENCLYNKCSICSYEHCREDNYCPNCGAKMKGESE